MALAEFPAVAVLGPRQYELPRNIRRRIAIECKASTAPTVSPGFWHALEELAIDEAWIVAPVKEAYPLRPGVFVTPLYELLESFQGPPLA